MNKFVYTTPSNENTWVYRLPCYKRRIWNGPNSKKNYRRLSLNTLPDELDIRKKGRLAYLSHRAMWSMYSMISDTDGKTITKCSIKFMKQRRIDEYVLVHIYRRCCDGSINYMAILKKNRLMLSVSNVFVRFVNLTVSNRSFQSRCFVRRFEKSGKCTTHSFKHYSLTILR